jgi:putative glycosyltransferase (TIGR04372 family)
MSLEFPLSLADDARALLAAGELERGLAKLRAHLAVDSHDLEALRMMIEASSAAVPGEKIKWTAHAQNAINELAHTGSMTEKTAVRVGRIFIYRRETIAARAVAAWLEAHFPDGVEVGPFLYDLYKDVGEPAAALQALARSAAAHPLDPSINLLMAERLIATGRATEALPYAVRLKDRDRGSRALLALARARIAVGEPDAAVWLTVQAQKNGDVRPSDIVAVVRDLLRASRGDLADDLVRQLLAIAPKTTDFLRGQAEVATAAGKESEAIDALKALVTLQPERANLEDLFDRLFAAGRIAEATAVATQTRELLPRSIAASVMRARLHAAGGKTERVREMADRLSAWFVRRGSAPMGRRGVSLAGVIGSHGLGDFIYQVLALASLKRQFSDAHLTLFYSNELTYKNELLRFCPDLDEVRDYAGGAINIPVATKSYGGLHRTVLFTQSFLSPTLLTGFERTATFVTPPSEVDHYTGALVSRGLDPDRWFVAIHYRQNSLFAAGRGHSRDVDADPFHRLAAWICEQGGQVVRLGHPGMPPIPQQPGYIDLSDVGLSLQLFAVSKARFMVGCDSGPSGYATAFKTPLFKTNTFSEDGAAYATDLILPKNLVTPWGEVLSIGGAVEDRLIFYKTLFDQGGGLRFVDNSFEQLRHGVQLMLDRHRLAAWRGPPPPDVTPPPEAIHWPMTTGRRAEFLDVAHLLGLPVHAVTGQDMVLAAQ